MTFDVRPQLTGVGCGVAGCDVGAEPILVLTGDVCSCGAFSDLRSATAILHIFRNNERTNDLNLAQKWMIFRNFSLTNWKVFRFKTMFKS